MKKDYHIYKNAPKCTGCEQPMAYLYTHVASNRSVWKCRECNGEQVTNGYPEDDDGHPSKRPRIFVSDYTCEYFLVPGVIYANRDIREHTVRV